MLTETGQSYRGLMPMLSVGLREMLGGTVLPCQLFVVVKVKILLRSLLISKSTNLSLFKSKVVEHKLSKIENTYM